MSDAGFGLRDPREVAAELIAALFGAAQMDEFIADVARRAAGAVEGAVSCGITVAATTRTRVLGATSDEFAERMDGAQYEVDDGPCLQCLRQGVLIEVTDIAADPRWPAFTRRAAVERAGSSMSIPLTAPDADAGVVIGALNLYSRVAGGLTPADRARGIVFADHVGGAVALAARLRESESDRDNLQAALGSRSVIDHAIGIIIARTGMSPQEAFAVLRQRSQHSNVKLREVAASVVEDAVGQHG